MNKWPILSTVAALSLAAAASASAQTLINELQFTENGTSYDQFPRSPAPPISAPGVTSTGFSATRLFLAGSAFLLERASERCNTRSPTPERLPRSIVLTLSWISTRTSKTASRTMPRFWRVHLPRRWARRASRSARPAQ